MSSRRLTTQHGRSRTFPSTGVDYVEGKPTDVVDDGREVRVGHSTKEAE